MSGSWFVVVPEGWPLGLNQPPDSSEPVPVELPEPPGMGMMLPKLPEHHLTTRKMTAAAKTSLIIFFSP